MKRVSMLVAALALCLSSAVQAEDNRLALLSYFEGCWRGALAGSNTVTDERCFAPMLGGVYVRDTHDIRGGPGAYSGETIYYFDAQAQRVAFTYYASDGGMSRGFAEPDDQGGLIFPPGQYVGADGQTLTMRATWAPEGRDRYLAIAEIEENGVWREHLRIAYRRAPDISAAH